LPRSQFGLFLGVPLLFGVMSLVLGQDANWDLRNYHWYNAYAFLQDRMDLDMGAAQTPTFYNPILDVPIYLAAQALPAKIFSFLLGAVQGCNFILLYMIAARTLRLSHPTLRSAVPAVLAFAGVIGGGHLSMVGTVFYDNIVSLFVFAAIIVVLDGAPTLRDGPLSRALIRTACAGVLVGLGVGMKLPTQIFAVGICFGLLFIPGAFARRFFLSFVCGLGVIAGFALLGGWWMWELWTHYANPLFPYFNDVIRSPWALPESYRDDRFVRHSFGQALLLPFRAFVDAKVVGEIPFRDGRILGAYIILLATPLMLLIRRLRPEDEKATPGETFVDVFAVRYLVAVAALSYLVWLKLFGIYRYAIPLEMLAPLLVVGCIALWPLAAVRRHSLTIGVIGFMVLTVQSGTWGRIPFAPGFGGKLVEVGVPAIADSARTMILMTGIAPTAFVIPSFPPEIAFLRPHSYLVEPSHATRFNEVLRARVAAHEGDFFLLRAAWDTWTAGEVLPGLGLVLDAGNCRPIPANIEEQLELCAVKRGPPAQDSPS
jgi:hypothetical protein